MPAKLDFKGQRFGKLVAVREVGRTKWGEVNWLCRCDCGTEKNITSSPLRKGETRSCGCAQLVDLSGQRFGKLRVIARHHGRRWTCICDCGNEHDVRGSHLTTGKVASCGCGRIVHGMAHRPEYKIWAAMISRCEDPNGPCYSIYGGRGIKVCSDWRSSFAEFYRDMDRRPHGRSIDRIDTDGDYELGNCRWATSTVQQNNRRNNRRIEVNGKSRTLVQWATRIGVHPSTISGRIARGWSIRAAVTVRAWGKVQNAE